MCSLLSVSARPAGPKVSESCDPEVLSIHFDSAVLVMSRSGACLCDPVRHMQWGDYRGSAGQLDPVNFRRSSCLLRVYGPGHP